MTTTRILTKPQAEAVYSAVYAMIRADGKADTMSFSHAIVKAERHGAISICGSRIVDDEHYAALADFAAAYGIPVAQPNGLRESPVLQQPVKAVQEPGHSNVWNIEDASGVAIARMTVNADAGGWAKRIESALNAPIQAGARA